MRADRKDRGKPESGGRLNLNASDAQKTGGGVLRGPMDALPSDLDLAEVLQRFWAGLRYPWHRDFANAAGLPLETTGVGQPVGCAANAALGAEEVEWMRLAVYGDHPYGAEDVQVFDRAAAEELVGNFRAAANNLFRRMVGANPNRPVYAGHPDHPEFSAQGDDDFTLRGEILDLEAREDGLYAKTRFTPAGKSLLEGREKLYWSPRWVTRRSGSRGGRRLWRPVKLLSSGLTQTPNIYGSAANAELNEKPNQGKEMELLKKMLGALGYEGAELEAILSADEGAPSHEAILAKLAPPKKEEKEKKEEELDAANAKLEAANAKLEAALADLANERKGRAELLVEQAIEQGRVAAADREAEIDALAKAGDFANAATSLLTRAKVLPTTEGKAAGIGKRKGEMQDMANAKEIFNAGLKDFANEAGLNLETDYQRAYGRFAQTAKGQELIAQMRKGTA